MNTKIFEICSTRLRVAFVLAIAEYALELLPKNGRVALAREGIDACWKWVSGHSVSPKTLHDFVEGGGEDLLGLASIAIADRAAEEPVLQVAATCIAYTAREAYLQLGQNLSETIELADFEAVEQIVDMYLVRMPGYSQIFLDRIAEYLLTQHKMHRPGEAEPTIDRDVLHKEGHRKHL